MDLGSEAPQGSAPDLPFPACPSRPSRPPLPRASRLTPGAPGESPRAGTRPMPGGGDSGAGR